MDTTKFRTIIALLITATLLDLATTIYASGIGGQELNPFVNWIATHIGITNAMITVKTAFLVGILPLMILYHNKGSETEKKAMHITTYIMMLICFVVVAFNTANIGIYHALTLINR